MRFQSQIKALIRQVTCHALRYNYFNISNFLILDFNPDTKVTRLFGTSKNSARSSITRIFALPSIGGAFTRTKKVLSGFFSTPSFREFGFTRT